MWAERPLATDGSCDSSGQPAPQAVCGLMAEPEADGGRLKSHEMA